MRPRLTDERVLSCASLAAAMALGPVFYVIGDTMNLIFGAAAGAYFLCCMIVIPLLIAIGGRLRFLTWQIAVASLTCTALAENNLIRGREIANTAYIFWAIGTLLSSPLPIWLILRPLAPRQRWIVGSAALVVGFALWAGVKLITG